MRAYPFCSVQLQQCVEILKILQKQFDQDDMETLMSFIIENLGEEAMHFYYESGRASSSLNKGQLMQIALELKQIFSVKPELENKEWQEFEEDTF